MYTHGIHFFQGPTARSHCARSRAHVFKSPFPNAQLSLRISHSPTFSLPLPLPTLQRLRARSCLRLHFSFCSSQRSKESCAATPSYRPPPPLFHASASALPLQRTRSPLSPFSERRFFFAAHRASFFSSCTFPPRASLPRLFVSDARPARDLFPRYDGRVAPPRVPFVARCARHSFFRSCPHFVRADTLNAQQMRTTKRGGSVAGALAFFRGAFRRQCCVCVQRRAQHDSFGTPFSGFAVFGLLSFPPVDEARRQQIYVNAVHATSKKRRIGTLTREGNRITKANEKKKKKKKRDAESEERARQQRAHGRANGRRNGDTGPDLAPPRSLTSARGGK